MPGPRILERGAVNPCRLVLRERVVLHRNVYVAFDLTANLPLARFIARLFSKNAKIATMMPFREVLIIDFDMQSI